MVSLMTIGSLTNILNVSATSASTTIPAGPQSGNNTLELYNAGASDCFVAVGVGSATAVKPATPGTATAGRPIPAGQPRGFSMPADATHIAAICASGETTTLYITRASGV